jgi:hypothetical protein
MLTISKDLDKVNRLRYNLCMKCIIAKCQKSIHIKSKGLCNAHYLRLRRHGTPLGGNKPREHIIGGNGRDHQLYKTWDMMIQRCTNPNHTSYHRYGGRGIKVCEEWRDSFNAFAVYMGNKPSDNHTLDRIDNDGDYEPNNVRWANKSEQMFNKNMRNNHSGVRGVGFRKDTNKWVATFKLNGIYLRISSFNTIHEAAEQRKEWELEYGC